MTYDPTRFSRVSLGWVDSNQSIQDIDANDTDPVFSVTGRSAFEIGSGKSAADVGTSGEMVFDGERLYFADSDGSFRVVDTSALTQ